MKTFDQRAWLTKRVETSEEQLEKISATLAAGDGSVPAHAEALEGRLLWEAQRDSARNYLEQLPQNTGHTALVAMECPAAELPDDARELINA